jgi:hypothetical protein
MAARASFWWLALVLSLAYLIGYLGNPWLPGNDLLHPKGWWLFWDQGRYLASATALHKLNFDPQQHWYLPGYALVGAPFLRLLPNHPFALPDLALLLACAWFLTQAGVELGLSRVFAMLAVLAGFLASPFVFGQWAIPWSSTLSAALLSFAAWLYLRCVNAGFSIPRCVGLGIAPVLLAFTRVSDVIALAPIYAHLAWLAWRWRPWRGLAAGGVAFLIAAVVLGALYLRIYGAHSSPYIAHSSQFGLRPSQIPFRFYTLFLDPHGFYGSRDWLSGKIDGIVRRWPITGLGLIATAYCGIFLRRHWALPACAVALICVYLSYPDWLPVNIWRQNLIHYVKWTFPLMGLMVAAMARDLWRRPSAMRLALPVILLGLGLTVHYVPVVLPAKVERSGPSSFAADLGAPMPLAELRILGVSGGEGDLSLEGRNRLVIDGVPLADLYDYRLLRSGPFVNLVLNRPLTARSVELQISDEFSLSGDASAVAIGGRLAFGW